jgi:two-component system, NtrC family, sensor histidine kinase KinB
VPDQAELTLVRRLSSLTERLSTVLDLEGVLRAIVEAGVELVGADAGVVSLREPDGTYRRRTNVNIPDELADHPIVPGEGMHGQVIVTGEPLLVDDYDAWTGGVRAFQGRNYHASIAVPIARDGDVIGALSLHRTTPGEPFEESAAEVLVLLARHAATALGNADAYSKIRLLLETMHDGMVVVEDGVVTAWNQAAAALTGLRREDVLGSPPPFDLAVVAEGVSMTGADGKERWVQAVSSSLGPTGDVHLLRDVTEQRELEQAKDLFFATTSHELKTPLTVIKGLASTLRKHWDSLNPSQREEALETMERRAGHLDQLIERILVGSRVEAGVLDLAITPVDIGRLVTDIVDGFSMVSPLHEVTADIPPNVPAVAGDRQAIDTILGHLVENAIKYSPDGGPVQVSVEPEETRVVVAVRDCGVGIEGDIERLLHPFVQADNRSTRRFGGVGLGLYIVRRLVDALGGEFWGSDRESGGAEFCFSVPTWR